MSEELRKEIVAWSTNYTEMDRNRVMDRLWLRIEQLERERDEARKQAEAYRDEIKYANVGWAFPWDATTPEEDDER